MFDERLMMLFTRMTRRDRDKGPQTDFVEERELSQINRELLGMTIADKLPEIAV